jgi:ABC-type cobalamin/Fe3+-siderophores transport system ATPase subunit
MDNGYIELSNVTVRRSGRTILDVKKLNIDAGQFVNLIGTNGAGKTTLLCVCCGLIKSNTGIVKFNGIDLTSLGGWQKVSLRKHVGYVPQSAEYNAELPFTVREVVAMGRTSAKPLFLPLGREDYEIVDYWLGALGLADRRNQTFRSLSGGEQQKTLIARAMTQQPAILMLDEPGANLDFNWKHKIAAIVEDLHRQMSITVLMVSHDADLLPVDEGRTVLLHGGKILADGNIRDVFESDAFEKAYGYKFKVLDFEGRKYVLSRGR